MLHIFDVDHTIIRKTSTWHFISEAFSTKDSPIKLSQIRRLPLDWIKYKIGSLNIDFIENTVKSLAGIEKDVLERIAENCFERRIKADIYNEAALLIREAQRNNERVIFATSSFDIVIHPLERYFGINGSLTSRLEFNDGRTTGAIAGNSFFGVNKKTAAQEWLKQNDINPAGVCFYSDSYTDIPLLEYCGNPAAVNPDRILKREAKKRGWKILKFREVQGNSSK